MKETGETDGSIKIFVSTFITLVFLPQNLSMLMKSGLYQEYSAVDIFTVLLTYFMHVTKLNYYDQRPLSYYVEVGSKEERSVK